MSDHAYATVAGITAGLFAATVLMILVRQRYPRWWFDFARELGRFGARVAAYGLLLTDVYPSKEALDEAMASGGIGGFPEQFNQLDVLLESLPKAAA